jgi:SHS2 domain-containing protein
MRSYKLLPHTADTRLYVEADTMEELFKGALGGIAEIIKNGIVAKKVETKSKMVKIDSLDQTSLLIDFLSEVLQYIYEEKVVYFRTKILKLGEKEMEAEIFGREEEGFDEDIKAVTYHEAEIKKNEKGYWEVTIVFDV